MKIHLPFCVLCKTFGHSALIIHNGLFSCTFILKTPMPSGGSNTNISKCGQTATVQQANIAVSAQGLCLWHRCLKYNNSTTVRSIILQIQHSHLFVSFSQFPGVSLTLDLNNKNITAD